MVVKNLTSIEREKQHNVIKYNFTDEMENLLIQAIYGSIDMEKPGADGEVVYTNVIRKSFALMILLRSKKIKIEFLDPENFYIENLTQDE